MDKDTIQKQVAEKGYASLTTAQKEVYNASPSITPSSLAPTQPVELPPTPTPPNYNATATGASAGATYQPPTATTPSGAVVNSTTGEVITPPPAPPPSETPKEKSLLDKVKEMLGITGDDFLTKPSSAVDDLAKAREAQDMAAKEKEVNDLNAQLADLTAQQDALKLEAQHIPDIMQKQAEGRGITAAGLAPLTAGELRKNALAMLPITQQILATSAKLNYAQGRLESAQKNIDDLLKVEKEDRDNLYKWQKDVFSIIYGIAEKEEQKEIDRVQKEADAVQKEADDFAAIKKDWANKAFQAGDITTATLMAQAKTEEELNQLLGQIKPSVAEWSEPYLMGGDYVQKNIKTGEIRTAVNVPTPAVIPEIPPEVIADYARRLDAGEIQLSNVPEKIRSQVLEQSVQAKQPRDFTDEEIRQLVKEDKEAGSSYEDIISAIDTFSTLKNKDRAKLITGEIFGKTEGQTKAGGLFGSFFQRLFGK